MNRLPQLTWKECILNAWDALKRIIITLWSTRSIKAVFVEREISKNRLNICLQCPNLGEDGICALCGCIVRLKTQVATEECPSGKW